MADASTSSRGDLKLTRITKSYGDFNAVDDLSLTIKEGSFEQKNSNTNPTNVES